MACCPRGTCGAGCLGHLMSAPAEARIYGNARKAGPLNLDMFWF